MDEQDETIGVTGVSGALTITPETITIVDDDNAPPALVVTPSSLTVGEGTDAKYTVKLATEPSGTVTVGIGGHGGTDLTPDTTSLEFTTTKLERGADGDGDGCGGRRRCRRRGDAERTRRRVVTTPG